MEKILRLSSSADEVEYRTCIMQACYDLDLPCMTEETDTEITVYIKYDMDIDLFFLGRAAARKEYKRRGL